MCACATGRSATARGVCSSAVRHPPVPPSKDAARHHTHPHFRASNARTIAPRQSEQYENDLCGLVLQKIGFTITESMAISRDRVSHALRQLRLWYEATTILNRDWIRLEERNIEHNIIYATAADIKVRGARSHLQHTRTITLEQKESVGLLQHRPTCRPESTATR